MIPEEAGKGNQTTTFLSIVSHLTELSRVVKIGLNLKQRLQS